MTAAAPSPAASADGFWLGQRPQQDVIVSLVEENRGLNEPRGGRKLRLTDGQRRRLAATARLLGRRALDAVATRVTPDTLMRWHRRLIAALVHGSSLSASARRGPGYRDGRRRMIST